MNQKRLNQMRSMNRGQEPGLQQILQPSAAGQLLSPPALASGQGGSQQQQQQQAQQQQQQAQQQQQQQMRRKMTYTRTELLCRGLPTTQIPRRSPRSRGSSYAQGNTVAPQTPLSAGPVRATSPIMHNRPRSYLPRGTRLQSPNRNLNRMRSEIDPKVDQFKKTPRVPNTPHGSHCSIPFPSAGLGHRPLRAEGSGIPVLDRSRNRETSAIKPPLQREVKDISLDIVSLTDTSSRSSSPAGRTTVRMVKPIALPGDTQNKSFVYLCKPVKKVKELLTARELRHSCENLELAGFDDDAKSNLQKTNSEELLHSKAMEQGLELSSITELSITSTSSTVSQEQQQQLQFQQQKQQQKQQQQQQQQLQQQQQQQQLQDNSNQERLLSQLTELRQRQQYLHQKEQRQKEMDLVCQNLPTLQHEIRLLQELNEKLESTLRGSNAAKLRCGQNMERQSSSTTTFYTPRCGPMLFEELPLHQVGFLQVEHLARITRRVNVVAFAHSLAVVREFRIETKTLDELKSSDETQCFYLPQPKVDLHQQQQQQQALVDSALMEGSSAPPPLQCTNLRMLRENPSALIQQLRRGAGGGGGGSGSYSLLDRDMFMFINSLSKKSDESFLYSSLAVGIPAKDNSEYRLHQLQAQALEMQAKIPCQQVNSTTQTDDEELMQARDKRENERDEHVDERLNEHVGEPVDKHVGEPVAKHADKHANEPADEHANEPANEPANEQADEQLNEQADEHPNEQDEPEQPVAPQMNLVQALMKPKKKFRKLKPPTVMINRKPRVIRRSPIQSKVEPKVRMKLFKTVLVGLVQVGVFLVLIMAFMYPDARC